MGEVLKAVPEFTRRDHIVGITDGADHSVYQTKWLKYGLQHLGLDDPFEVPEVYDAYSAIFWMDYREWYVDGPGFSERKMGLYPYLGWAEAHFHRRIPAVAFTRERYPMTWEAHASAANYDRMSVICGEYVEQEVCAPHAWHAAEMLLYLLDPELEPQVTQLQRHRFPSE